MPLPQSTGWVDYSWYPRVAFFGVVPIVDCFDEPPLEVERGLVPDYLADGTGKVILDESGLDAASGASLGLQLPLLRGGEAVELHHLHRARTQWRFAVPPAPRLLTDGRKGAMNPTDAVLHTLIVEPDADRVTVLWRGCAPALAGDLLDRRGGAGVDRGHRCPVSARRASGSPAAGPRARAARRPRARGPCRRRRPRQVLAVICRPSLQPWWSSFWPLPQRSTGVSARRD